MNHTSYHMVDSLFVMFGARNIVHCFAVLFYLYSSLIFFLIHCRALSWGWYFVSVMRYSRHFFALKCIQRTKSWVADWNGSSTKIKVHILFQSFPSALNIAKASRLRWNRKLFALSLVFVPLSYLLKRTNKQKKWDNRNFCFKLNTSCVWVRAFQMANELTLMHAFRFTFFSRFLDGLQKEIKKRFCKFSSHCVIFIDFFFSTS